MRVRERPYAECVGFVGNQIDDVEALRRFCWEHCWNWRGVVEGDDLLAALRLDRGIVKISVTSRKVVKCNIIVVPSYTVFSRVRGESGNELLTMLARNRLAIVSATEVLGDDEIEWLTTRRPVQRRAA